MSLVDERSLVRRNLLFIFASLAMAACSGNSSESEGSAATEHVTEDEPHEVHWGYEGNIGPKHWAGLSDEFAVCASGKEQSPIDLTSPEPADSPSWTERIGDRLLTEGQRASVMDLVDNGHTIQVTKDVPMVAIVDGVEYELVQYHFHAPSEHTIDGRHLPLEVHLVHKSAVGDLAVIGVLFEEGEHDKLWEVILSALPDGPGDDRRVEDLYITIDEFWPIPTRFYRYDGSLTTPPCSEGVKWVVMADRLQLSADQIAELASHLHDNNRPVQPLNERTLHLVSVEESED